MNKLLKIRLFNHLKNSHLRLKFTRNVSGYTVSEINIPSAGGGFLTGKLWKGEESNTEKKQKIICTHGWIDNCCSFDPLIPLIIKPNMEIFAMDLPGHGFSSHTSPTFYDCFFEGLIAFQRTLKYFKWEKATLLGHSLGAIVSFICAATFPEHVDKYIALDNVRPIPRDITKCMRKATSMYFDIDKKLNRGLPSPSYTYEDILEKVYKGRNGTINIEGCKILLERGARKVGENKYEWTHDLRITVPSALGRFTDAQTRELAKNVICPVLVIKGEPGQDYEDRKNFIDIFDIMKSNHPDTALHYVPGTHHFHLNDPESVASLITPFLELNSDDINFN